MRGRWVPVVSGLPLLPPAEGLQLPERPVPWSAPAKDGREKRPASKGMLIAGGEPRGVASAMNHRS